MDTETREAFWKAFARSPYIMIRLDDGNGGHAEPMTAQLDEDAHHAIWFYTRTDNRIAPGGAAMAQFASKDHDVFACLMGRLLAETDAAVIDRHWSNIAEAWFPEGRNDPSLLMLRFEIDDAEVWTQDPSIIGRLKLMTGNAIRSSETGRHAVGPV